MQRGVRSGRIGSTPAELLNSLKADKALNEQVTKLVGYEPQ
jgi:hypothetical protein